MKIIIQDILLSSASLYITSLLFSGLIVNGGIKSYVIGGLLITIGQYVIKPVLKVITLPFTLLSFGLFSFLINALVLLTIHYIYPNIEVKDFYFPGLDISMVHIPSFHVQLILSYLLISGTIYFAKKLFLWVFN